MNSPRSIHSHTSNGTMYSINHLPNTPKPTIKQINSPKFEQISQKTINYNQKYQQTNEKVVIHKHQQYQIQEKYFRRQTFQNNQSDVAKQIISIPISNIQKHEIIGSPKLQKTYSFNPPANIDTVPENSSQQSQFISHSSYIPAIQDRFIVHPLNNLQGLDRKKKFSEPLGNVKELSSISNNFTNLETERNKFSEHHQRIPFRQLKYEEQFDSFSNDLPQNPLNRQAYPESVNPQRKSIHFSSYLFYEPKYTEYYIQADKGYWAYNLDKLNEKRGSLQNIIGPNSKDHFFMSSSSGIQRSGFSGENSDSNVSSNMNKKPIFKQKGNLLIVGSIVISLLIVMLKYILG